MKDIGVVLIAYGLWLISMWAFRYGWAYEVKIRDKRIAELEKKYEN